MCARIKIRGAIYKPGQQVPVTSPQGQQLLLWDGFARSETLSKWQRWKPVEIPCEGFAERHDQSRNLVWDEKPTTIQAISSHPRMRVVTRQASQEELRRFGHKRVPVTHG
jgi:hypothetical protein